MFDANVLHVMIASPSDVGSARDAVELAIATWNTKHAQAQGVVLLPWRWETSSVPELGAPAQTLLNKQGVDQADIVIALLGSRLGSPTQNAVSGTVEEIERARSRGVPVHLYFSTAPFPQDVDIDQVQGLRQFKTDVQSLGLYAEFDELDQLSVDIDRALSYDVEQLEKRKVDAYFEVDVDREYELFETHWTLSHSMTALKTLSGHQEGRRRFTCRTDQGIEHFEITLSRESDKQVAFGQANVPDYQLLEDSSRSDGGAMRLQAPHKTQGGSFSQRIVFEPPVDRGSSVDLRLVGDVTDFKFATLEQLEPSTRNSKLGLRDWDYVALTIGYPMAHLKYSAFFPDELGVDVLGVRVGRGTFDVAESARLRREGYVSQERTIQDGLEGVVLTLEMPRPRLKWTYRLCWRPPSDAGGY